MATMGTPMVRTRREEEFLAGAFNVPRFSLFDKDRRNGPRGSRSIHIPAFHGGYADRTLAESARAGSVKKK